MPSSLSRQVSPGPHNPPRALLCPEARGQMLSWLALVLTLPARLLKVFEFVTPTSFTWEVQSFQSLAPRPAAA